MKQRENLQSLRRSYCCKLKPLRLKFRVDIQTNFALQGVLRLISQNPAKKT